MLETSMLPRDKQVNSRLNMGIVKTLKDLEGDTQQRNGSIALWIPWGLLGLRIATTSALLEIFGRLRLLKQGGGIHTTRTSFQCQHRVSTLDRWNLGQWLSQASVVG